MIEPIRNIKVSATSQSDLMRISFEMVGNSCLRLGLTLAESTWLGVLPSQNQSTLMIIDSAPYTNNTPLQTPSSGDSTVAPIHERSISPEPIPMDIMPFANPSLLPLNHRKTALVMLIGRNILTMPKMKTVAASVR